MDESDPHGLAALRREYADVGLDEQDVHDDPLHQFRTWLDAAVAAAIHEPNAMVLSTVGCDGRPSSRMVLLKGLDERGFVFFTNLGSRKGAELADNPGCALLFPWHPLERQVRVTGTAQPLPADEVEAYFASRPRGAQLSAWASRQSAPVADRQALATEYADAEARFEGRDVEVPAWWGGYRVRPDVMEFWQGRGSRMHDRLEYVRSTTDPCRWTLHRLAP